MGGSRGIGRGIARRARPRGGAGRDREPLARSTCEQRRPRSRARWRRSTADTADLERLAALPGEVAEALGPVEILVTNTGGPPVGRALDAAIEDWRAAYDSLVLAPRVLIEAVLPGMRERGWGRIVNVGSSSTREPIPGLALSNSHRLAAGRLAQDARRARSPPTGSRSTRRHRALRHRPAGRQLGRLGGRWSAARPTTSRPAGSGTPGGVRRPGRLPLLRARRPTSPGP